MRFLRHMKDQKKPSTLCIFSSLIRILCFSLTVVLFTKVVGLRGRCYEFDGSCWQNTVSLVPQ